MPYNKALLAKAKKDKSEAVFERSMFTAQHKKPKPLYWVVNKSSNKRSDRAVTMDEFVAYLGPKASRGVYKQYHLVKAL